MTRQGVVLLYLLAGIVLPCDAYFRGDPVLTCCSRPCCASPAMCACLQELYEQHVTVAGLQVQTFKRMQYMGRRSVWSDVLVGQGPLFSVDRAVCAYISSSFSHCIYQLPAYSARVQTRSLAHPLTFTQVELHYPSKDVPGQDSLKMQLSYDNEKFTSEWIMMNDGRGHQVDLITVTFVYR
jgi:hypothetical protein